MDYPTHEYSIPAPASVHFARELKLDVEMYVTSSPQCHEKILGREGTSQSSIT